MDQFERQLQNIPKLRTRLFFRFFLRRKLRRAARQLEEPRGFRVFRRALAAALVLFLLASGTTAYAYATPSVTHGNPLYALKRSAEQVQLFFVRSPERRVVLFSWIAERRLQEVEILLKKRLAEPTSFIPKAYAQSLLETLDPDDPLALTIRDMLQATEKAAELTEGITEPQKAEKALEALERVTKMQKRVLVAPHTVRSSLLRDAFQKAAELHEETQRVQASVSIAIEDEEPEILFTLFPKRKWKGAEHALDRAEETLSILEKTTPMSENVVSQVKKSIAETRDVLSKGDIEKAAQLTKKTMELTRSAKELLLPKPTLSPILLPPTAPEPAAPFQKSVQKRVLQSLEKAEQELNKLPEDALRSSLEEKVKTAQKALEEGNVFDAIQAAKEVRITAKEKLLQEDQEPQPAGHIPPQKPEPAEHIPPQKPAEHIPPQKDEAEKVKSITPTLVELERRFASLRLLFEKMDERRKTLEENNKLALPKDILREFSSIRTKLANFTAIFGRTRTDEEKLDLLKELDAIEEMIDAVRKDLSSR